MSVEFWPYWLGFGASVLWALVIGLLTYNVRETIRQWRCVMMLAFYIFQAIGYGFLAFGQTYLLRSDGIKILFGRWWLYLLSHPFGAVTLSIGLSQFLPNHLFVFLGTAVSSAALVGLAYTPSKAGTNDDMNLLIYWLIIALMIALGMGVYTFFVAMNWQRLWYFPQDQYADEGRTIVQNRIWHGLAVVLLTLGLMLYCMLAALGPEGWNKYAGKQDKKEFTQIWVTLALDCVVFYILIPAVYILLDPSGASATTPFEVLQPVMHTHKMERVVHHDTIEHDDEQHALPAVVGSNIGNFHHVL